MIAVEPNVLDRMMGAIINLLRWAGSPLRPFFPAAASAHASAVDLLYEFMVVMSALLCLGIGFAIVYFAVKYRRGSKADRSHAARSSIPLELAWTLIPLIIMIGIFLWGAYLYLGMFGQPQGAETVYVTGKQWMWKVRHAQGQEEINEMHVPVGKAVRVVLASDDVIHSFFLPAFRLKRDVVPGRITSFWFQASSTGESPIFCSQYCGNNHSAMIGRIVVMAPEAYGKWLQQGSSGSTPEAAGEAAFKKYGCIGCHKDGKVGSAALAPSLAGIYGHPVSLQGGGSALADEAYLRESIYFPNRKIAAGFAPIMPPFAGVIPEDEMINLIAYIRSLAEPKSVSTISATPDISAISKEQNGAKP